MNSPIIDLNNIHFRYSEKAGDVLQVVNLQVYKGQHLFIQGPSGSGKTTLLNLITGINQPYAGSVQILNESLQDLSSIRCDQFRVDYLGIIFQQFNLLPYLSVVENVQLPCWFSARRSRKAGISAAEIKQTAVRLLDELSLPDNLLDQPANALSVGQQQRVAVARALIGQPEIVIADEPTSSLDSNNRERFLELLFMEADKQKSTLVFVSHDTHIAKHFSQAIDLAEINESLSRNMQ